jgi:hypothetical protein
MTALGRIATILLALAFVSACRRARSTSGQMPHDVYIWQRVWIPEVAEGIAQARESMQRFVVFAGQITVTSGAPKVTQTDIDYRQLKAAGKPVGLAIRVDPYAGPFRSDDAAFRSIEVFARERLTEARRHGVEPVELHFDFDCAESKLDGYRVWLQAIREAVSPLPVYPTVLPSWLKHDSFAELARESGQFILQVHCVSAPRSIAETRMLTDPERARDWVKDAAKTGVPFRVALPTYTYLVAFDLEGKPRGVSAEGPLSHWPANTRVVRWEADPSAIAGLVAEWTRGRPAAMKGIIWYRLPIAADSLNWRWVTLSQVMQGHAPISDLRVESSAAQPSDIFIHNKGERDEPLPREIEATWDDTVLITADALSDYELAARSPSRVVFRLKPDAALSRLSPGSQRPIGWIRCEKPAHIRVVAASGVDRPDAGSPPIPSDSSSHGH